jgi:hypothetical protein
MQQDQQNRQTFKAILEGMSGVDKKQTEELMRNFRIKDVEAIIRKSKDNVSMFEGESDLTMSREAQQDRHDDNFSMASSRHKVAKISSVSPGTGAVGLQDKSKVKI